VAPQSLRKFGPIFFVRFTPTKPAGRGTGLGLSISRETIESHAGRLTFDDHCQNTRFVVELPREMYHDTNKRLEA
jgi:signal transduction histidine kinase